MIRRIKVLFLILILAALGAVAYSSLDIKDRSIRELYKDVTFMRITMDARQYISQIEYGVKNGRELDNFYNMHETLKGIQGCSSYMEGAYIVSVSGKLLYQSGLKPEGLDLAIPKDGEYPKGTLYSMEEDNDFFYLTVPIKNGSGQIEGYLLMCIGRNSVNNAVMDYNQRNRMQTVIIVLELLGIALFILKRIKPNKKSQIALRLMLLLSITFSSAAAIDSGLVMAEFYQIVDDAARQSANKMAQALQSDVDSIIAKGVAAERIYDLNGWLAKKSSELEIVTSLTLDRNHKITANVSQNYINGFLKRFLLRTSSMVFLCLLFGVIACGTVMLYYKLMDNSNVTFAGKGVAHA